MTDKALKLSLVIPGLLGPFPPDKNPETLPSLPAVECLLAKASRCSVSADGLDGLLFRLFDIAVSSESDLPVAAVSLLAEYGQTNPTISTGYWLRADPVHLMAQQDKVYLVGHDLLPISKEEAAQLAAEFNALYAEDGWQLQAGSSHHWYLQLQEDPHITTIPLANALGFDIGPLLPKSKVPQGNVPEETLSQKTKDLHWHGIMNEIQMLLHGSGVNQARETRGEASINGLWLWGGGELPTSVAGQWQKVWSDDCLAQGLATLTQTTSAAIPDSCDEILTQHGQQLLVLDALRYPALRGDMAEWSQTLDFIEADWFGPILTALQSGRLAELILYPANGQSYTLSRTGLRRWWRRRLPLGHYLQ